MKVLMVCLGNICRSPMAEGILRSKTLPDLSYIEIDSAGTGNYHIGEPPDNRAILCMKQHGHDISNLRARQFHPTDFDRFDCIFAMDQSNLDTIVQLARNKQDKEKVKLILSENEDSGPLEVPDPYFGGHAGFEHVYDLLNRACDRFLSRIG